MRQDIANDGRGGRAAPSADADHDTLEVMPGAAGTHLTTPSGGVIYAFREPEGPTVKASAHIASITLAPARTMPDAPGRELPIGHEMRPGAICFLPANAERRAVRSGHAEKVIVAVRPSTLQELATSELGADDISLEPPPYGTVDLEALHMAELLKFELTRPYPPNELFVDSLIRLVGIHLLRNYATLTMRTPTGTGTLSARDTRAVREFLLENFTRKMSLDEIAEITSYSKFHFIRAFRQTFGRSPHQYVLDLRLTFAEDLLKEGNLGIAEIASLSGFSSQSHLTAVMKKYRAVTPAAFRRKS